MKSTVNTSVVRVGESYVIISRVEYEDKKFEFHSTVKKDFNGYAKYELKNCVNIDPALSSLGIEKVLRGSDIYSEELVSKFITQRKSMLDSLSGRSVKTKASLELELVSLKEKRNELESRISKIDVEIAELEDRIEKYQEVTIDKKALDEEQKALLIKQLQEKLEELTRG